MSNVVTLREVKADLADAFDRFWQAYPHKARMGAARRAWMWALTKADNDPERIIAAAQACAAHHKVKGTDLQYILKPAAWLQDECWHDVYEAPKLVVEPGFLGMTDTELKAKAKTIASDTAFARSFRASLAPQVLEEMKRRGYLP